jgi:hypothetical protein
MAQPTPFSITITFASDEANGVSGRSTLRTSGLDGLFQAVKTTLDQILVNLALIQRDDGQLLDQTVTIPSLSTQVLALLSSTSWTVRGGWVTTTAYAVGDLVLQGGIVYVCMVAHTSGTFATDLAAGKWGQVTANATAATTSFSPTSSISAITVQAAISELDNEVRPVRSILVREIFNGL